MHTLWPSWPPMIPLPLRLAAAVLPCLAVAPLGWAGDRAPTPLLPAYRQECGSCHVAYPPGLLPAAAWQRLLDHLPQHFGTDASLDGATTKALADWLVAHAGAPRATPSPQDRITRSTWFLHEHGDVPPAAWARPAVRSATNCAACHPQADQGDFNEHRVRIPR
jgi:diheme cytochrome c